MSTLRRKQETLIHYLEVYGEPMGIVLEWKHHRWSSEVVPKTFAIAYPGNVIVTEYDPHSKKQTRTIYKNMEAVRVHYEHDEPTMTHVFPVLPDDDAQKEPWSYGPTTIDPIYRIPTKV